MEFIGSHFLLMPVIMLPRSYNSINENEDQPTQSDPFLHYKIQIYDCWMKFCHSPLGKFTALLILGVLLTVFLLLLYTGICIFIVMFNTIFEKIIVLLFDEETYKKNFPICNRNSYDYHRHLVPAT